MIETLHRVRSRVECAITLIQGRSRLHPSRTMVRSDIDGESKMKKLYLTAIGIAALGLATPASAADMAARPYKAPPPVVAPIYDWSGFYIGANGGSGNSRKCSDIRPLPWKGFWAGW